MLSPCLHHLSKRDQKQVPGRVSRSINSPPPSEQIINSWDYPRGRELLDFWNGGANVLMWGLQFGEGEIIWGLKLPGLIIGD